MVEISQELLSRTKPNFVLIQGGSLASIAFGMSAFYEKILLGHLNAGLRTKTPNVVDAKEVNSAILDRMADICFAPFPNAKKILLNEAISKKKVFVTGNIMLDSYKSIFTPKLEKKIMSSLGTHLVKSISEGFQMIFISLSQKQNFEKVCKMMENLAREKIQIIFFVYIYPNQKYLATSLTSINNVILSEALNYPQLLYLAKESYLVITDSKEILNEAILLNTPVVVLQEETAILKSNQAETIKQFKLNELRDEIKDLLENKNNIHTEISRVEYGLDPGATKVVRLINRLIENETEIEESETKILENPVTVSIILVTRNIDADLEDSLTSVLRQTFSDFELITVIIESNDIYKILKKYDDPRIRFQTLNKKINLPSAINEGLKIAKGKYITWMKSGDILQPPFLESLLNVYSEFPEASLVKTLDQRTPNSIPPQFSRELLFKWSEFPAFLWEKKILEVIGFLNENLLGSYEREFFLRLLGFSPVAILYPDTLFSSKSPSNQLWNISIDLPQEKKLFETLTHQFDGQVLNVNQFYPTLRLMPETEESLAAAWTHLGLQLEKFSNTLSQNLLVDANNLVYYFQNAYNSTMNFTKAAFNLGVALARAQQWKELEVHIKQSELDIDEKKILSKSLELEESNNLDFVHPDFDSLRLFQSEKQWINLYANHSAMKAKRPFRLAVIPSDPLIAYVEKGREHTLQGYYNPAGFFDEVYVLSPYEKKNINKWGMKIMKTSKSQFKSRLREFKIDVVRAYGGYGACDFAVEQRLPDIPVICSIHDTKKEFCCHNSIKSADYLWPVSYAVKDKIIEHGAKSENIFMFTNRVDTDIFSPINVDDPIYSEAKNKFLQRFPGKYRILHVGRKAIQKNPFVLMEAIKILGKDYIGIFAGSGGAAEYKKKAQKLDISSQVHILGTVKNQELAFWLAMSDIHCTPSLWEGFGVTFIEAMATGSVVVTSDISPMNEYIEHEVSGILVQDYKNPQALAEAIQRAVTDQELRAKIKVNARKTALKFSQYAVDKWEVELYRHVLHQKEKK